MRNGVIAVTIWDYGYNAKVQFIRSASYGTGREVVSTRSYRPTASSWELLLRHLNPMRKSVDLERSSITVYVS